MQLALFDFDDVPEVAQAFLEFHRANPHVFERFVHYTREAFRAGRPHFGARMIGERLRWYYSVEVQQTDEYRFNNNHWAYYARLCMLRYPEFEGFFETREMVHSIDASLDRLAR